MRVGGRLPVGKRPGTHFTGGWGIPESGRRVEKHLSPTWIRPRTVQPVVSRNTNCYPVLLGCVKIVLKTHKIHKNTRKELKSRIRTLARHAGKQTWSHTEFLSTIETTVTTAHRLERKGNSNNRDLEYRDFTVFEPAVTRKGVEMDL
jgi:hypothetical protein